MTSSEEASFPLQDKTRRTPLAKSQHHTDSAPVPPSALGLVNVVLVVLITAVGGLGMAAVLNTYFANQELVLTSLPYASSRIMVLSHDEVLQEVGNKPVAVDNGRSTVNWKFPNSGNANIQLAITGQSGSAKANLLWSRIDGQWVLLSATWTDAYDLSHDIAGWC